MTTHPFPDVTPIDANYVLRTLDALIHQIEQTPKRTVNLHQLDELYLIGFETAHGSFEWLRTTPRIERTVRVRTVVERVVHLIKTSRWLESRHESTRLIAVNPETKRNVVADVLPDASDATRETYYRLLSLRDSLNCELEHGQTPFVFEEANAIIAKNDIDTWFRFSLGESATVRRMALSQFLSTIALDNLHVNP